MGYENPKNQKQYIIENDVEESDKLKMTKKMKTATIRNGELPDNYELEEDPVPIADKVSNDIYEAAQSEGLVTKPLGGENPTHEEVIQALKEEQMPEGALKNKEEYEEKQIKTFKEVTATRDLIFGRAKKHIPVKVQVVMDVEHEDGTVSPELVDMVFQVKRLTESEVNHIINHRLFNKKDSELTDEEYQQSTKFRSNFLEATIVDPKITAQEWREETDAAFLTQVFNKVSDALNKIDDATLFQ